MLTASEISKLSWAKRGISATNCLRPTGPRSAEQRLRPAADALSSGPAQGPAGTAIVDLTAASHVEGRRRYLRQ
ncbi:hypothetical protein F9B16_31865 [Actinomadura montaniterrae]|uniref:Uncharacterized protein n=1 Tax=Actinomadura montaniterrae TaxID=1803903 RepID=A0A6L3VK77_9ACTN|nr:hypothetical protein F9B16_31865 [Actinomadura montaniterrae]